MMTVPHMIKNSAAFYGTLRFVTVFTSVRHLNQIHIINSWCEIWGFHGGEDSNRKKKQLDPWNVGTLPHHYTVSLPRRPRLPS